MKLFMVDRFVGESQILLGDIETIEDEAPIKAARRLFKNVRRAKEWENPDLILTEVSNVDGNIRLRGHRYCYMVEE